jgi:hypothetical protein
MLCQAAGAEPKYRHLSKRIIVRSNLRSSILGQSPIRKCLLQKHLHRYKPSGTQDNIEGSVGGSYIRRKEKSAARTRLRNFENPRKQIVKTNLLAEEFIPQQSPNLEPNADDPKQTAIAGYPRPESRVSKVLRPLDQLSESRRHLYTTRILTRGHRASSQISRYLFESEQTRESPVRIGIFAGLSGEDEVGPAAVSMFLADLVALPHLGNDLRVYAYPIVSAVDFETRTSCSQPDQYTISQTGRETLSSETYQIEREIFAIGFDGVISIRIDDGIETFQVGVSDRCLHDVLVRPILSSLEPFIPNIEDCESGTGRPLTAGIRLKRRPFEMTFRVPSSGWSGLYAMGLRIALHTVLSSYRAYQRQKERSSDWLVTRALQMV